MGPVVAWFTSTCCTAHPGCSRKEQSPLQNGGGRGVGSDAQRGWRGGGRHLRFTVQSTKNRGQETMMPSLHPGNWVSPQQLFGSGY